MQQQNTTTTIPGSAEMAVSAQSSRQRTRNAAEEADRDLQRPTMVRGRAEPAHQTELLAVETELAALKTELAAVKTELEKSAEHQDELLEVEAKLLAEHRTALAVYRTGLAAVEANSAARDTELATFKAKQLVVVATSETDPDVQTELAAVKAENAELKAERLAVNRCRDKF